MGLLVSWLTSALVIMVAAYFLPGIHVENFLTALVLALVLGILNAIVKPILFFFTLPITIVTLGLFTFVLNALIVLCATYVVRGFTVHGFLWALAFSIALSLLNALVGKLSI